MSVNGRSELKEDEKEGETEVKEVKLRWRRLD